MNSMNGTKQQPRRASSDGLAGLEYYGFREYKRLLFRRKWMIVAIALLTGLGTAFIGHRMPDLYKASTTVIIDPGKVPESYVKSTATLDANQRLAMLQGGILSTTSLSQVVDELGLYDDLKKTKTREEIVVAMRKDIKIEPVTFGAASKELQAFSISFVSQSAKIAALVANRLASLFIEENLKVRSQQVLGTADFFDRELEKAKKDLDEKTEKLDQLRVQYASDLPEAQNLHVQALTTLQLELRSQMDAISQAEHQKVYLQSLLADSAPVVNLDGRDTSNTAGLQEELGLLQEEMDQLRTRYGPSYPDVVSKEADIESLKNQIKDAEKSGAKAAPSTAAAKHHNPVIESQIAQLDDEIKKREGQEKALKSQIGYFESKLDQAPAAEQQLTAANNDYTNAADHYKRLEDHKFTAELSSDVESRQKGERFVILDPAVAPEHPYQPNRPLIDVLGLVVGLGLALFLVVLIEILNSTVKTQRELTDRLKAPVFGEIPWLMTKSSRRRRLLWTALALSGNAGLAAGYFGLLAVALR